MQVGAQNINILPIPKHPQEKQTLCKFVNTLHGNKDQYLMNIIEAIICKIYGFSDKEQLYIVQFAKEIYQ